MRVPAVPQVRRPRFMRINNPAPIRITKDDTEVVRYVYEHRFRRTSDIVRHLPHRSNKKLKERLRDLYDHDYLDRPDAQLSDHNGFGNPENIHAIGNQGARLLAEVDGLATPKSNWRDKNRQVKRPYIQHALRIGDTKDAVSRLPHQVSSIRIIDEVEILRLAPEMTRKDPKPWLWQVRVRSQSGAIKVVRVKPDDIFGLDLSDIRKRYFFAVEADRGTEPISRSNPTQSSVGKKFQAYLEGWHSGLHTTRYGINNLRWLFVTTGQQRIETMLDALAQIAGERNHDMFLFADFKQVMAAKHILAVPWLNGRGHRTSLLD